MSELMLCRAIVSPTGKIMFQSQSTSGFTIQDQIAEDKRYGIFKPRNGKYFTYAVYGEDTEIKNEKIVRAVGIALRSWVVETKLQEVKIARPGEQPDFKFRFRTPRTDDVLTNSTLMYMYYPINDLNNALRGLCTINADYFWTIDGNPLDLHIIDPIHYPSPAGKNGKTFDLDQVLRHELGHALGLPHSKFANNIMSANYSIMAEHLSDEDIARIRAKYGEPSRTLHIIERWRNWIKTRSEKY